jgi:hypothetical protein
MFVQLIKARTCNGCAARFEHHNPYVVECQLDDFECTVEGKPLNKCPKPLTNKIRCEIGMARSRSGLIYSTDLIDT